MRTTSIQVFKDLSISFLRIFNYVSRKKLLSNFSTQIRKRPVVAKQKDWPEKKIKDENNMVGKIDEKNPEVLAKKIIAQGRNLEKSKSSAMLLSPRSKVCSMFFYKFQHLIFHSTERSILFDGFFFSSTGSYGC